MKNKISHHWVLLKVQVLLASTVITLLGKSEGDIQTPHSAFAVFYPSVGENYFIQYPQVSLSR